jgi:hypothetical protein
MLYNRWLIKLDKVQSSFLKLEWLSNLRTTLARCTTTMKEKLGSALERAPQSIDQIALYIRNT